MFHISANNHRPFCGVKTKVCFTLYPTDLTLCFSYCDFLVVQCRSGRVTLSATQVREVLIFRVVQLACAIYELETAVTSGLIE